MEAATQHITHNRRIVGNNTTGSIGVIVDTEWFLLVLVFGTCKRFLTDGDSPRTNNRALLLLLLLAC